MIEYDQRVLPLTCLLKTLLDAEQQLPNVSITCCRRYYSYSSDSNSQKQQAVPATVTHNSYMGTVLDCCCHCLLLMNVAVTA